jgi:hypothetical protein
LGGSANGNSHSRDQSEDKKVIIENKRSDVPNALGGGLNGKSNSSNRLKHDDKGIKDKIKTFVFQLDDIDKPNKGERKDPKYVFSSKSPTKPPIDYFGTSKTLENEYKPVRSPTSSNSIFGANNTKRGASNDFFSKNDRHTNKDDDCKSII